MRILHLASCILGIAILFIAAPVAAQDSPHDFGCQPCHRPPIQPSTDVETALGNVLLCESCHNPTGQAGQMSIGLVDKADPFGAHSGTSHAFLVAPENPAAGAQSPQSATLSDKLIDGQVVCSTCHNQHEQDAGAPFLRAANDADQLCLDCHRSRDMGTWQSNPANNIGNHPVGVQLPLADEDYQTPPDGSPHVPLKGGDVVCSTCHAVHFENSVDSRQYRATSGTTQSASFASPGWTANQLVGWEVRFPGSTGSRWEHRFVTSNTVNTITWNAPLAAAVAAGETVVLNAPGTGDGTLVRGGVKDGLCTTCHTYEQHSPGILHATCLDCHEAHGTTNILLVRNQLDGKALVYTGRTAANFVHGAPNYDGVCETCHTSTSHHRNNASGDHEHYKDQVCTNCHLHKNGFKPDCGSCHAATPETMTSGSHPAHFQAERGPKMESCDECHGPGASSGGHVGHQNGTVNFSGATLDATTNCDSCHSKAGFVDGSQMAKSAWDTGVYQTEVLLLPDYANWCASCHDDNPGTSASNESSLIDGQYAKPIMGNNTTYGYYVTGHGRSSSRYPAMSWQATTDAGNPAARVQCGWCHDMQSTHMAATGSRLRPGYQVDQANTGCNQCHANGGAAAAMPQYYAWSDTYEASTHGEELCSACHDPHGIAGPNKAMMTAPEETLCYQCHGGAQGDFAKSHRHDVDTATQAANNSRVECTMCHNPHLTTGEAPLANPDNLVAAWTDGSPREFCLACHDGAAPKAVRFPATSPGSGWNQTAYRDTIHDEFLGGDCLACHNSHGTDNTSALLAAYSTASTTPSGSTVSGAYALCFTCHNYTKTITNKNSFSEYHKKHVVDEDAPCIACHDAHAGTDAAESGLINFKFPTTHGFDMSLQVGSNTYNLSTAFQDTGTDRGSCFLTCHGEGHGPERYTGVASVTVDCLACHTTPP